MSNPLPAPAAPAWRRAAAWLYDLFLLTATLFVAAIPVVVATGATVTEQPLARLAFQAYLLGIIFLFHGWFWTHGGQTLGMRAWRLRVVTESGGALDWTDAVRRFATAMLSLAAFGLGLLWMFVDRERRGWHDRLSGTRVVLVPR